MGYDMRAVNPMTDEEKAAHQAASKAFRDACDARDAAFPRDTAQPSYNLRDDATRADIEAVKAKLAAQWPGETIVEAMSDFGPQLRTARYHELQEAVNAAYSTLDATDITYFRLNIWGMGEARGMLYELGMVHNKCHDARPDWPDSSVFDLDEHPDSEVHIGDEWFDHRERPDLFTEQQLAFFKAEDDVRSWSPEVPGIPVWKFGSNDGWHVTPVDIQGALHNLRCKAHEQDIEPEKLVEWTTRERPYVAEFIEWMGRMVERGGFRVY